MCLHTHSPTGLCSTQRTWRRVLRCILQAHLLVLDLAMLASTSAMASPTLLLVVYVTTWPRNISECVCVCVTVYLSSLNIMRYTCTALFFFSLPQCRFVSLHRSFPSVLAFVIVYVFFCSSTVLKIFFLVMLLSQFLPTAI